MRKYASFLPFFLIFLLLAPFQIKTKVVLAQGLAGDANLDGVVDGVDYVIWLNNFNKTTGNGASEGDFNQDGIVDMQDYAIWLPNYGSRITPSPSVEVSPSSIEVSPTSTTPATVGGVLFSDKNYQGKVAGVSTANLSIFDRIKNRLGLFFTSISSRFSEVKKKILPEPKVISYLDARKYAGKQKTVEGEIKEIVNNKKAVYLGFKKPHTGEFVVRILEKDWKNFSDVPDKLYREGQKIRVTGKIEWYQGDPVIYVQEPSQIVVLTD